MLTDTDISADVSEIIQFYFSARRQSLTDAFSLDNSVNTLIAKDNNVKDKIAKHLVTRENERIYELQRYFVLGSGLEYYKNCTLDYRCCFFEQYTEAAKLFVTVNEIIKFTEKGGTIVTDVGITHRLEFTQINGAYFLSNDAYSDTNITGSIVDENGIVAKGLLYPDDLDLREIIADSNYNTTTANKSSTNNDRAITAYNPSQAASYALTYYGVPNYKNYIHLGANDCANFVSQCLAYGGLAQKTSGSNLWYYTKSSTVCTCTSFNPNHTCRNNDAYAYDWSYTSLRTNIVNNSYGSQHYASSTGTYSCSAMTTGDLLFVNGGGHVYICVGYNSSTGKLRFADHNMQGSSYGSISEKNIYYMSNYYIVNMY